MLAQIYRRAFEHAGWEVAWVSHAQAALEAADQTAPDIVVLELQLISHSGVEFLYEFRSYSEWQNIPVVVHSLVPPTAFGGAESLQAQLGIARYHYKLHTSITQLLATLRQFAPIEQ